MSSGLPCVVGNMEGIATYIKGDTESIIIPNSNKVASYVNVMKELIDSEDLRLDIGLNARKRILDKFFYKTIAKDYLEIYQKLLSE